MEILSGKTTEEIPGYFRVNEEKFPFIMVALRKGLFFKKF